MTTEDQADYKRIHAFLVEKLGAAMPDNNWLFTLRSAREAARELGTSTHHLANLRWSGKGCGYVQDGRRIKYANYLILYHQLTRMKTVIPGERRERPPAKRGRPRKHVRRKRAIRKSPLTEIRNDAEEQAICVEG